MEELFDAIRMAHNGCHDSIELDPPIFSPAVDSRSLRSRIEFLRVANLAGLIPQAEWDAMEAILPKLSDPNRFFEVLRGTIPVAPGRRGSQQDVQLHYSEELWRKAKSLNRKRAVLACTMAHLIALKRFVHEDIDVLLEDNTRVPPEDFANRIQRIIAASEDWSESTGQCCHLRYFGWLGSIPNIRWIYDWHIPAAGYQKVNEGSTDTNTTVSVFPFPDKHDIEASLAQDKQSHSSDNGRHERDGPSIDGSDREPGGNAIWGAYGYWMSREGYQVLMRVLRNDVGALLWKGKRAKHYSVKPIDKIMPRLIRQELGDLSVHLPSHPVVFRAPMLTSKIHTQWDPEFCKSTEFQLQRAGALTWDDLWLPDPERMIVEHYAKHGVWLTLAELSRGTETSSTSSQVRTPSESDANAQTILE